MFYVIISSIYNYFDKNLPIYTLFIFTNIPAKRIDIEFYYFAITVDMLFKVTLC